jgi:hypothetical protein
MLQVQKQFSIPTAMGLVLSVAVTMFSPTLRGMTASDVVVIQKLAPPLSGYIKKTTHSDGSIDMQAYRNSGILAPWHATIDPPEYEVPGQKYPVTLKFHQVVAGDHLDFLATFDDPSGAASHVSGNSVDADGKSVSFDLSFSSGIVNGRVTERESGKDTPHTDLIKNMPIKDLQSYLGGLDVTRAVSDGPFRIGFDPGLMTSTERDAWQKNEKIVEGETLGAGKPSNPQQTREQLVQSVNAALSAQQRCNTRFLACTRPCATAEHSIACLDSCGNCDSEQAAWQTAFDRLNAFDDERRGRQ